LCFLEISHESFSRKAFALGAKKAVEFAKGKSGYFEMSDVLNLKGVLNDYLEKDNNSLRKRYASYVQDQEMKAQ
jgi:4-hydroxy-tetrahydrodipicolinate reductase